jgi:hypothetical protein
MAIGGVKDYLRIQDAIKYLRAHPLKVLGYASGSNALIEWMKSGLDDQRVLQNLAGLLRKAISAERSRRRRRPEWT